MKAGWRAIVVFGRPDSFRSATVNGGISISEINPMASRQNTPSERYEPANAACTKKSLETLLVSGPRMPPAMPPANTRDIALLLKSILALSAGAAPVVLAGRVVDAEHQRSGA